MDKLTAIRVKEDSGSYSAPIPIGAEATNVIYKDKLNAQEKSDSISYDWNVGARYGFGKPTTELGGGLIVETSNQPAPTELKPEDKREYFSYIPVKEGKIYCIKSQSLSSIGDLTIGIIKEKPIVSVFDKRGNLHPKTWWQRFNWVTDTCVDMKGRGLTEYNLTSPCDGYLIVYTKKRVDLDKVSVISDYKPDYPELTREQRRQIYNLINEWVDARSRKEIDETGKPVDVPNTTYAYSMEIDNSLDYTELFKGGKLNINCNTFVTNIMMGRKVSDYMVKDDDGNYRPMTEDEFDPTGEIHTAFDFGWYPSFIDREFYGVAKWKKDGNFEARLSPNMKDVYADTVEENNKTVYHTGLYNLSQDEDGNWYSVNTYQTKLLPTDKVPTAREIVDSQTWKTYFNANDLAYELEQMGCVIPYSEINVGDIVFFADSEENINKSNANFSTLQYHKHGCYKHIGHVAIVREMRNGEPVFVHSAKSATNGLGAFSKSGFEAVANDGHAMSMDMRLYSLRLLKNVVMVCRMPVAFGYAPNVPENIVWPGLWPLA